VVILLCLLLGRASV